MRIWCGALVIITLLILTPTYAPASDKVDTELKVAYVGDIGSGKDGRAVLKLIKDEGAELAVLAGDLDYVDDPALFERMIDETLGAKFPYVTTVGNHDLKVWDGDGGYQALLKRRLKRLGIPWEGNIGVRSKLFYRGLSIVLVSPGTLGYGHADYIKEAFEDDQSKWKVCVWHKNQAKMQAGSKGNETGWGVYEECREAGAMILSGHAHVYSRTYPLKSMIRQEVVSRSDNITLQEGETIAIVSGLGGHSLNRRRHMPDDRWWAKTFNKEHGALFCTYLMGGEPEKADCYFKGISGSTIDAFKLRSEIGRK